MAVHRLHTKDLTQPERDRLAAAVIRAREKMGWTQKELQERARVSRTSMYYLESGNESGVSATTYEKVARALPGWTEKTPLEVAQGGPPPEVEASPPREPVRIERPQIGSDEWILELAKALDVEFVLEIRLLLARYWKAVDRNAELEERILQLEELVTQSAVAQGQR